VDTSYSEAPSSRSGADPAAALRQQLDVLVVGAGQAGLAMAWHLARRRVRYLLVDANHEIVTSWRSRWDSLTSFTPLQFDGMPGAGFPGLPHSHPAKHEVADTCAFQQSRIPAISRSGTACLNCTPRPTSGRPASPRDMVSSSAPPTPDCRSRRI
jgi:cation diffusion facilitator CzcD-associated flavoprotein CzcO